MEYSKTFATNLARTREKLFWWGGGGSVALILQDIILCLYACYLMTMVDKNINTTM